MINKYSFQNLTYCVSTYCVCMLLYQTFTYTFKNTFYKKLIILLKKNILYVNMLVGYYTIFLL